MTRKRFDSAPHINVKEEGVLIQQVAGSSTNLLEVKAHDGATLMAVDYAGTMTSGASNAFTYLAATTSASLPANTTIGAVSSTELGYLDGVTSAIQTQLDSKLSTAVTSAVAGTGISVSASTGAVTFANTGVTGLTGTANQITVSASTGSVTLSLPQNIHTGAAPTFAGITSTGNVTVPTTSATYFGSANGSNFWRPIDQYNNSYFRIATGNWYSDASTYFFRNESSGNTLTITSTGIVTASGNINYTSSNLVWMGGGVWDEDAGWSGVGSPSGNRILMRHPTSSAMYIISRAGGGVNIRDTSGGGDYNFNNSRFTTGNRSIHCFNIYVANGDSNTFLTYNNNNSGLPWHYGPTLVGYNGWSYYSQARARFEMGHRDNTSSGHIYAWVYGGLLLGSQPNDSWAGTATLTVNGSGAKTSGGVDWAVWSDARLKDNIVDYAKGLSDIVALRPRSFVFNGKNGTKAGEKSVGLIAQEVEALFPDSIQIVELDPEDDVPDPKLFNYNEINFALINAVKELHARVVDLENANRP